ncbi:MAG: BLUF domain-containing protein [Sphingomonadaceae bacterium]|nr:BLUF domain-containing protein [Sphingomonadaceae bacterium]
MFQLVYISTARQPIVPEMVEQILAASRRNNARNGISGLLVAGRRRFLQALEGPEQAVLDAYAEIKRDPRHHALVLLTGRSVETRAFGDWSMAFEAADEGRPQPGLAATVDALTASLADKSLRAHFLGFAELQSRAA